MGRTGVRHPIRARCANCATELTGPYCHACGQSEADPLRSLSAFVRELSGDMLHLQSRTLRTLAALLRPGLLTRAYIDGQRVRYLGPLPLYLLAAALFFLVGTIKPLVAFDPATRSFSTTLGAMGAGGALDSAQVQQLVARGIDMPLFQERFQNQASAYLPLLLIVSVLVFAAVLRLFYPGHAYRLPHHTVFVLHWSALYLLAMVALRLSGTGARPTASTLLISLATLLYLVLALRRVYRQGWGWTIPKGLLLYLAFNVILAAWVMGVIQLAWQSV